MREHTNEGSAREDIVSADLRRKGFEVFRGDSRSSFDLVAYKHKCLLRIEVKGIKGHCVGRGLAPVGGLRPECDCRNFDVLAAVQDTEVFYKRSIVHAFNQASRELITEEVISNKTTKKNLVRQQFLKG